MNHNGSRLASEQQQRQQHRRAQLPVHQRLLSQQQFKSLLWDAEQDTMSIDISTNLNQYISPPFSMRVPLTGTSRDDFYRSYCIEFNIRPTEAHQFYRHLRQRVSITFENLYKYLSTIPRGFHLPIQLSTIPPRYWTKVEILVDDRSCGPASRASSA